jgi:hypothetical protein
LDLLPGQRRRESSLRAGLPDRERQGSEGERHDQTADDQGWFSGKTEMSFTLPGKRSAIHSACFYDSCRS